MGRWLQPTVALERRQAALPLSRENSYFEVQVLDKGKECAIAVGVAHRQYPLDQMPGWRNGSIAYHMDDGKLYFRRGQGNRVGEKCGEGDVVGCGIELSEDGESIISVYWTRNGQLAGVFIFEAPPPAEPCYNYERPCQQYGRVGGHRRGVHRRGVHASLLLWTKTEFCARRHQPQVSCGPTGMW